MSIQHKRFLGMAILAFSVGIVWSVGRSVESVGSDGLPERRALCAQNAEAIERIGEDIRNGARTVTQCRTRVPSTLRTDFSPGRHFETADIVRASVHAHEDPEVEVSVVVVEVGSAAHRRASLTEFIVDSRYYCENDQCWPTAYEVYVTPEEIPTDRVDQLVAIAFGAPRDVCDSLDWIERRFGCDGTR